MPLGWGNHFFVVQMSLVCLKYKDVNTIYYLWLFFMRGIFFFKNQCTKYAVSYLANHKLIFEIDGLFAGLFQVIGKRLEFKLTFWDGVKKKLFNWLKQLSWKWVTTLCLIFQTPGSGSGPIMPNSMEPRPGQYRRKIHLPHSSQKVSHK